jgi:phage/plasmid-associated DNA primase
VVCSGNADQAKTLTQWLAHLIQKPTQKAFATIIYGKQGTGKSILYEFFTRCIGKDLGLQVGKLEDLTQTHNTHVRGKLIINANEATNEPALRDVNILKGLITETDLIINPKGVNQYTVSNYSRLLITSNYKQCMRLDADDRRYFCLEISDAKKNNDAYFAPLVQSLTNEATQQAFFDYLANYDISDFHHQRPPLSAMKRDMIGANVSNIVSFVKDVCENNIFTIPFEEEKIELFVSLKDMYQEYDLWCRQNDTKGRKSSRETLHAALNTQLGIEKSRGPRPAQARGFKLNREAMLPHFQTAYAKPEFEYIVAE